MAKALIGYMNSDLRTPARLVAENDRLRTRVGELETLVRRLSEENDKLAAAHWGLARAYESLQRFPEMFDELKKTTELDPANLEAKNKLGNYYLAASRGKPELVSEAERLAKEALSNKTGSLEIAQAQAELAEAAAQLQAIRKLRQRH